MLTSTIKANPARLGVPSNGRPLFGGARRTNGSAYLGNGEPSLADLMDDPMMVRLMDRDGVARESLQSLIEDVRARLA
jgi:hypothetical protein